MMENESICIKLHTELRSLPNEGFIMQLLVEMTRGRWIEFSSHLRVEMSSHMQAEIFNILLEAGTDLSRTLECLKWNNTK